ncbi:hypothetical protein M8A51_18825 [Schlegelella sp. S2-27]|uniref:Uncharacterized protein n=1 Tax=Caldimonas mangrovi TaxID=2944811 RepID=A0ABT0YT45_9BURK|nr:hypothetical protein [Caldimonas mangrovi]MCM5681584.1 hypothetical protein [Caldimonas mangrovi]
MSAPQDRNGSVVRLGARVRLLGLSGRWLEELPQDERHDVLSMIGQVFEIEEIDGFGHAWVRKSWPDEAAGTCRSHSIALEPHEMELVSEPAARPPSDRPSGGR